MAKRPPPSPSAPAARQARPPAGVGHIRDLRPDPENRRVHNSRNIGMLVDALNSVGAARSIVVDEADIVLAGNGVLEAAAQAGITKLQVVDADGQTLVAVRRSNLTPDQKRTLALYDNRAAELAEWNIERLQADAAAGLDLKPFFFDQELTALLGAGAHGGGRQDVDDIPPIRTTSIVRGDLFELGPHRLLCGDSTLLEDAQRVLASERAAIVATDPPYLIDYTGSREITRPGSGRSEAGKDWTHLYREIDITDAAGFLRKVFVNVLAVLGEHAPIYCWHASKRTDLLQGIWKELQILDHQQIIWVKPGAVFGHAYWKYRHEPCLMGWRQGSKPTHDGDHSYDSVWEVDWEGKSRLVGNEHPTQKPVELFARPIRKHTRIGAICFEPFSGSGSQLIAGEMLARKIRAIEMEPQFVQVAIDRWERFTGQKAAKVGEAIREGVTPHGARKKAKAHGAKAARRQPRASAAQRDGAAAAGDAGSARGRARGAARGPAGDEGVAAPGTDAPADQAAH